MPEEKKGMSCAEAGHKGGTTTRKRYGLEFYTETGRKGGTATKERYGRDFYEEMGRKGGLAKAANHSKGGN